MKLPSWVWIVPAVMSALALAPLPYGYYMLLRLVVCGAATAIAWNRFSLGSGSIWGVIFIGTALMFNPIFPVHFSREVWAIFNVVTAAVFLVFGFTANRKNNA